MAVYYYLICFLVTFLMLGLMIMRHGQKNVNIIMVYVCALCANGAYLAIAVSHDVPQALTAVAFCYLGEAFLPMFIFYIGADLCGLKISRFVRVILSLVCLFVLSLGCSPLFSDLYYRSVTLSDWGGATYLVKDYGPLHMLYYIVLFGWFAAIIAMTIYAVLHSNLASYKTTIVYVVVMVTNIAVYLLGSSKNIKIELLPLNYVFSEFLILSIAAKTSMYDMTTSVLNVWEKMENYAYIVLDKRKNYIGANALARVYFPELAFQDIDLPVRAADPVLKSYIADVSEEALKMKSSSEPELREMNGHIFRTNLTDFLSPSGKKIGYIIEFYDVTKEQEYVRSIEKNNEKLRIAEENARKASAAKDEFLSSMSHEIRTPINTILGMNEMIERESDNADISRYSRDIEHSGKMLLSIINDVLDFSKIEAGRMTIYPAPYSSAEIFGDIVSILNERAGEKNLSVITKISNDIPSRLIGDDVRIRQVVMNLVTNAVKYTESGGVTLAVDTHPSEDEGKIMLSVSVRDTGAGIREEDRERIFTEFSRVGSVNNRHIEGTGLGLAITKRLVDSMGGVIELQSEVGKGSEFTVEILQEVEDSQPMGDLQEVYEKEAFLKKEYSALFEAPGARILAVDDNAMNLTVITELLKKTKIRIDTASGGYEALSLTRENRYDIILMDHMMPEPDGIMTLKMLRSEDDNENREVPVIALTANAVAGSRELYLSAGFSDYISKPVDPEALEEKLFLHLPKEKVKEAGKKSFFDHEAALSYAGGDEEILEKIMSSFVSQGRIYEKELPALFESGKPGEIQVIAHTLKSGARTIGAGSFSEEAKVIEELAKSGNAEKLREAADDFMRSFAKVLFEAEKHCSKK